MHTACTVSLHQHQVPSSDLKITEYLFNLSAEMVPSFVTGLKDIRDADP